MVYLTAMKDGPARIGRYEILSELGKGSMGTVYEARDPVLDRVVALKTIRGAAEVENEARERFLREARSVARLSHPNIVTIYEMGEVEGIPFIAMEFLEGQNLSAAAAGGRLPEVGDRLRLVEQLCRGLGYAHRRGVIHRDLKPSNIFLLADGAAKVLDFGVAWLEGGTFATRTGMLVGTPAYMAPEQFSGEAVDHRVDVWSLGVVLYELLAGARPFAGETVPTLIYRIVHEPLTPLETVIGGLSREVLAIVSRALEKDAARRYPDMEAMAADLRTALGDAAPMPGGRSPSSASVGEGVPTTAFRAAGGPERRAPRVLNVDGFRDQGTYAQTGPLRTIVPSPDQRVLAVGGIDGSVRLLSLEAKVALRTLRSRAHLRTGHTALTTSLAFSPDGAMLAAGHLDGAVDVWDAGTGLEVEARLRHEGAVGGVAFHPDGTLLLSGGHDATLKFWEVPALLVGEGRRTMRRQPAAVTTLVIAEAGDVVFTGHGNRNLRAHDATSGRLVATFHGLGGVPSAMARSGDGGLLAVGGVDGSISLFRVASRALLRHYEAHSKTVSALVFLPDGRHLASVAMDREVAIWEVSHEDRMATLTVSGEESCASLAVLERAGLLICGTASGSLHVWHFD